MANIKQQKKRILVTERQRVENTRYRSSIKTAFRRVVEAVQSGDTVIVDSAHVTYVALVDRAAARRALHPNTAARKKARVTRVIARGPQIEETKKRRVTRKTAVKVVPKKQAAAIVEAPVVEETVAEEAVVDQAAELSAAVVKKPPVKKKATPKKKAVAAEAPTEDAPAEADRPLDNDES